MPRLEPTNEGKGEAVLWIAVLLLLALVLAGAIVLYVAYPHRGRDVPGAPWLGEALRKGVDAVPTLDDEDLHASR